MDDRTLIRTYLFSELLPIPPKDWPRDGEDLFTLGLDSLRIMRLLVFLEERLKVIIPDQEITSERLASIDAIVALVGSHRA